jgi:hypothetical protein
MKTLLSRVFDEWWPLVLTVLIVTVLVYVFGKAE